jgi:pimeloyl-ACP methyl ester carboxylesterase
MTNHDLTVDDRGTGLPVLLLHGGAGPLSVLPFAEHLAATRPVRVLTPTIPGFEGTPRWEGVGSIADLARMWLDLLAERDLSGVTLVGNSIGGWTAAEMLTDPRAAERIAGAVLLDPVGIAVPEHPIRNVAGVPLDQLADLTFHDPQRYRIDPATLPPARRPVLAANAAALADYAGDPYMHDPSLRERLASVGVPVRVLWGESDGVVTPDYGRAFAAALPGAEFTLVTGAGHVPQIEQPDRTRDLVWECADRHAARSV